MHIYKSLSKGRNQSKEINACDIHKLAHVECPYYQLWEISKEGRTYESEKSADLTGG